MNRLSRWGLRAIIIVAALAVTVGASAWGQSPAPLPSPTKQSSGFTDLACPKIVSAKVTVSTGNAVGLDARVRTGYDKLATRITLREAKSGLVSFVMSDVVPYETAKVESLSYVEELPLNQPRTLMILRLTLRHPDCEPVLIERPFWPQRPVTSARP